MSFSIAAYSKLQVRKEPDLRALRVRGRDLSEDEDHKPVPREPPKIWD